MESFSSYYQGKPRDTIYFPLSLIVYKCIEVVSALLHTRVKGKERLLKSGSYTARNNCSLKLCPEFVDLMPQVNVSEAVDETVFFC